MAFFNRRWQIQSTKIQAQVKGLVVSGQLEFVNGGWCMHDEAATHYIDMIDQTTLGHDLINKYFNVTPRAGWQIDPFRHSAVQAYLLGAEIIKTESSVRITRHLKLYGVGLKHLVPQFRYLLMPFLYIIVHQMDSNLRLGVTMFRFRTILYCLTTMSINVVEDFVTAAQNQANVTRTNHIMWTMGNDFGYQYAESWFKEMYKLIHYVNQDGRVNALYSTPSIYTDAKNAANKSWPLKTDMLMALIHIGLVTSPAVQL